MELFHDQLPLAVPCYNLLPVTELTVGRDKRGRRAFPAPLSCWAVSTKPENVFTVVWLTYDY